MDGDDSGFSLFVVIENEGLFVLLGGHRNQ